MHPPLSDLRNATPSLARPFPLRWLSPTIKPAHRRSSPALPSSTAKVIGSRWVSLAFSRLSAACISTTVRHAGLRPAPTWSAVLRSKGFRSLRSWGVTGSGRIESLRCTACRGNHPASLERHQRTVQVANDRRIAVVDRGRLPCVFPVLYPEHLKTRDIDEEELWGEVVHYPSASLQGRTDLIDAAFRDTARRLLRDGSPARDGEVLRHRPARNSAYRKQSTMWSFTSPVACIWA